MKFRKFSENSEIFLNQIFPKFNFGKKLNFPKNLQPKTHKRSEPKRK